MGRSRTIQRVQLLPHIGELCAELGGLMADPRPDNKYYYKLYEGIAHLLPDMDMILNLHDTPLIFIHREERERLVNLGRAGKCRCIKTLPVDEGVRADG